jgi:hypothetical protein
MNSENVIKGNNRKIVLAIIICLALAISAERLIPFFLSESGPYPAFMNGGQGIILGFIAISPSFYFLLSRFNGSDYSIQAYLHGIFGFFSIYWFYFTNDSQRQMAASFYRYTYISPHLADWAFIPSFISCKDTSGCDPFGRFPAYGQAWKILLPLSNLNLSIFILAITTSFFCFQLYKLANKWQQPFVATALIISPSFVFSLDRGNSDLFLAGMIMLSLIFTKSSNLSNLLIASFLGSLKLFFAAFIFREKLRKLHVILFLPIIVVSIFWSYGFSLERIRQSRILTLYSPYVEFGVDQLPSFFVQQISNQSKEWSADYYFFQKSLVIGLLMFLCVAAFIAVRQLRFHIQPFDLSSKFANTEDKSVLLVFSALYLFSYLSGSQVWYKTWFAFPILFLIVHKYQEGTIGIKFYIVLMDVVMVISVLGISVWSLRTVGNFLVALYALSYIVEFWFKPEKIQSNRKTKR